MSGSSCCFLTCIQISQEAGQVVWYSHLFKNFPEFIEIHTVKGFSVVSGADIYFSGILLLFLLSNRCYNLIFGSSAFSKSSLNIWKFSVHLLLKPGLKDFEHYLASVLSDCNSTVVEHFLALPFFGIGMNTGLFPVQWPLLSFSNLLTYWMKHFKSISF